MATGMHRDAAVLIDRSALYYNINSEVQRLQSGCQLFMVVKANAYGHGAVEVAKVAKQAGASGFCVAILDEALELRHAGFKEPILILGISRLQDLPLIANEQISVTVPSIKWLTQAVDILKADPSLPPLKIHLGLDTGMGRIGLQTIEEVKEAETIIDHHRDQLDFEGIFTHFATADELDESYFKLQWQRFNRLMGALSERPRYVHVSNSATSLWHDQCNGNMVRFGVAGYGLNPSGNAIEHSPYSLRSALSIVANVTLCKKIEKGRSVSYGATYTADEDQFIATVPVGYADGIPRRLQGFEVLINGKRCPIVGRVCMDQLMVRVKTPVEEGTKVTFVGQDGDQEITLQSMAEYCGTIHYELACQLTARLPRKYVN